MNEGLVLRSIPVFTQPDTNDDMDEANEVHQDLSVSPFLKLQLQVNIRLPSVDFDRRCVNAVLLYRMWCINIK